MTVHEKPVGGSVEWFTPSSLFNALLSWRSDDAVFWLDPASAESPYNRVPAVRKFTKAQDGLSRPWDGHVWLNPPYGPAGVRFVDRMVEHGDGLLLLPSRTETRVYQRAFAAADVVCLLRDRLWFTRGDGYTGRSSFGSTLFAFGDWAAHIVRDADLGVIARAGSAIQEAVAA